MIAAHTMDLELSEELPPPLPEWARARQPSAMPGLCQSIVNRLLGSSPEYKRFGKSGPSPDGLRDYVFISSEDPKSPQEVFGELRWGGVCVFASLSRREVDATAEQFRKNGFVIEQGPAYVVEGWCKLPIPLLTKKTHGFVARKVELLPPGLVTSRFTYDVQLARHSDPSEPLVVLKQVPTLESVIERLSKKHPDYPAAGIERLASKFVHRVFPTFLTREAGMLKILQDYLPAPYNQRVPRLIDMEKDERGFVRRLRMSWLRNGGEALSQLEFARQSADLLRALHDFARVIHLDLRLDNFVVTPQGVGFVDFGSSVRETEDLSRNPLLQSLFGELMRTSQIQQMMERMTQSGQVTSQVIRSGCNKPDKAADFFYLALQFNSPHANPDLAGLIKYDPTSPEARKLANLTSQILRPKDPTQPTFRSAKDILHGIERMHQGQK